MSREVPANKLSPEVQAQIVELAARGRTSRQIGTELGCAHSTAQEYLRDLSTEIEEARAKLSVLDPSSELDAALSETIAAARSVVELIQTDKDPDNASKNGATLARLLKELHHARQLRLGAPTSSSQSHRTVDHTTTIVEVSAPGSDPLGPLHRGHF